MDVAVTTGIFTLLGVILGVALGSWQEQRRAAQARRGVRLLLKLEIQQNLAALFEFRERVSGERIWLPAEGFLTEVGASLDEGEFNKRQRLAREPLPEWRHLMWQSQAGLTAMALSRIEIDRAYTLHSDLDTFTRRQTELREAFDTPEGKKLAEEFAEWMQQKSRAGTGQQARDPQAALRTFNEKTRPLWSACEAIFNRALPYKDTNPIEEDTPLRRWRDRLIRLPRHPQAS
jgi:hypothetical protein